MREDRVYLQHIAECIRRIEENTSKGREEFLQSHTIQDAVLRNLQTMSEATQRLSDDAKSKHPQIEWSRIVAFRNVLVHNYLGIDLEIIWGVTQRDVAEPKTAITGMLKELS